jgi:hypothetical protein
MLQVDGVRHQGLEPPSLLIKRESRLRPHLPSTSTFGNTAAPSGRPKPQELPPIHATNHATQTSRRFRRSQPVTEALKIIYGQVDMVEDCGAFLRQRFGPGFTSTVAPRQVERGRSSICWPRC